MKVICEIGSNWSSLNDCHLSIQKAKDCGADFVKFQLFTTNSLFGPHEKFNIDLVGKTPYLHPHWIPHLSKQAKDIGIEFMCSAFSPREYEMVNPFVNYHKIASAELTDINILRMVNSFKKPVFLSTGGSDLEDIKCALQYLRDCEVTVMYCVAEYPAKIIDFKYFKKMQFTLGDGYDYGYSDHSMDILNIPVLARDQGATVIEKHVNFSSSNDTADAPHSLSGEGLALLIANLRGSLTSDEIFEASNKDMRSMWRRKFVATQAIKPGDKFKLNQNIGIFRTKMKASDPVSTFRHWDVDGHRSASELVPGDVICYKNISEKVSDLDLD